MSFSKLDLDCTSWLDCVPNVCLPSPQHPIFDSNFLLSSLDVDNCLCIFQRLHDKSSLKGDLPVLPPKTPIPTGQLNERLISPTGVGDLSPVRSLPSNAKYECRPVATALVSPSVDTCTSKVFDSRLYNGSTSLDNTAVENPSICPGTVAGKRRHDIEMLSTFDTVHKKHRIEVEDPL